MSEDPPPDLAAAFLADAPGGFAALSQDGRIIWLNETLARWLGQTVEGLKDRPISDCLSFGGRVAFETHLAPILRLNGEVNEVALDLLSSQGKKVPVLLNARVVLDDQDQHRRTDLVMMRSTGRQLYERNILAEREKAEAELSAGRESATLREQFIAVLGHDLRNPLAALAAGTRLLGREGLSERGALIINQMELSLSRASLLIDNVLDFARGRLGEGLILTRDAKQPLTPVLEQVVGEICAIFPERSIRAEFSIREPVDCDRQRIGQLAANLLSNAVTHGADDLPIVLEARTEADRFTLSVTNGGNPIPAEAQANLFQPFFRGDVRQSQQGLGLGLFIVSEIAKAHGGTMDVASDERDTCFRFSIDQSPA